MIISLFISISAIYKVTINSILMVLTIGLVWSDLKKRKIAKIIFLLCAFAFIAINFLLDNSSDFKAEKVSKTNDSLQRALADTLQTHYHFDIEHFSTEIQTLNSVTNKLTDLNNSSSSLNQGMDAQSTIQKEINKKTQNLYLDELKIDSARKSNDQKRLYQCFGVIEGSIETWSSYRTRDSITQNFLLAQMVERNIERFNSQSDNEFLNSHTQLSNDWNRFEDQLGHIYADLTVGYNKVPFDSIYLHLDMLSIGFRSTINNHFEQISEGKE